MSAQDLTSHLGGLEKLKITAFSDVNYDTPTESFVVMYNPTNYRKEFKSVWVADNAAGRESPERKFRRIESDSISFEFLFDATGASPPGAHVPGRVIENISGAAEISAINKIRQDGHVEGAIGEFFRICQQVQSETHQPNNLQINWGLFEFRGVLESAIVNYKLFNPAGLPIRATISANFKESISPPESSRAQGLSSPDLTHYRQVKEGDTLPLMVNRIYQKPELYIEVAKANNLKNFRRLKSGARLSFPPLEKGTK